MQTRIAGFVLWARRHLHNSRFAAQRVGFAHLTGRGRIRFEGGDPVNEPAKRQMRVVSSCKQPPCSCYSQDTRSPHPQLVPTSLSTLSLSRRPTKLRASLFPPPSLAHCHSCPYSPQVTLAFSRLLPLPSLRFSTSSTRRQSSPFQKLSTRCIILDCAVCSFD